MIPILIYSVTAVLYYFYYTAHKEEIKKDLLA